MNQTELELIHRELDGENSPKQSREFHALLERDTTARRLYEDLSSLTGSLENMRMVDPPADLRDRVMSSLPSDRSNSYSGGFQASTFFGQLWSTLTARPAVGLAYAFAVGLLAGLALYGFVLQPSGETGAEAFGTLISNDSVEGLSKIHGVPISQPGLEGDIAVYKRQQFVVIEMNLSASEPASVLITPENAMALRGFSRETETPVAPIEINSNAARLYFDGQDRYVISFDVEERATFEMRVQVLRDDRVLEDFTLPV